MKRIIFFLVVGISIFVIFRNEPIKKESAKRVPNYFPNENNEATVNTSQHKDNMLRRFLAVDLYTPTREDSSGKIVTEMLTRLFGKKEKECSFIINKETFGFNPGIDCDLIRKSYRTHLSDVFSTLPPPDDSTIVFIVQRTKFKKTSDTTLFAAGIGVETNTVQYFRYVKPSEYVGFFQEADGAEIPWITSTGAPVIDKKKIRL
jgi:hypothetical protein